MLVRFSKVPVNKQLEMSEIDIFLSTEEAALQVIQERVADSQLSHLWSDALFARAQARSLTKRRQLLEREILDIKQDGQEQYEQSKVYISRYEAELQQIAWDLGSFVRWTVITACMAFERAAVDATNYSSLSRNMYKNLPRIIAPGLEGSDFWKKDPWIDVQKIREKRNKYVHRNLEISDLFVDAQLAEDAIHVLRKGIKEIYEIIGKAVPLWVKCDDVPRRLEGSFCAGSVIQVGAIEDSQRFRIVYIHGGRETLHSILRSDNDPWPTVKEIALTIQIPIESIRIYKGENLWREILIKMRGS